MTKIPSALVEAVLSALVGLALLFVQSYALSGRCSDREGLHGLLITAHQLPQCLGV
jgi:hypothetical protein